MPGTDTRHIITSSEDANPPPPTRQISQDGTEIIPTRILKVTTPKPASNPLQFIKTGPCDLYKAAQEQIKKVEEIKKVEKVKDDSEDWQSNLDNWKCSRRKRQEHIIERVVEVKKLEMEEHDRNRRRSKTFNEMMEERNLKGGLRKMSILSYSEDDSNDLSDLGICNKEKSSGDYTTDQIQNGSNNHQSSGNGLKPTNGHGSSHYDEESSSTPATISSPEPEEYTYERAIQGYMNFAEAKVKTPVKPPMEKKEVNGSVNFKIGSMKKEPSGKIGEKLSELEQIRLSNKSTKDMNGGNEVKQLPKVDISKRRSLFEKAESKDEKVVVKSNDGFPKDFSGSKSIKERLSSLEKSNENVSEENHAPVEVGSTIKETIGCLEKQRSVEVTSGKRLSNGDVSPQISVKERLNSLKHSDSEGQIKSRSSSDDIRPVSVRERMSSFDGSSPKDASVKVTPERDSWFKEKLETFKLTEKNYNDNGNIITESSLNICSDNKPNEVSVNRLNVEDFKNENKELSSSSETMQNLEDVLDTKPTEKLDETLCKQKAGDLLSVSSYQAEIKTTPDDPVVMDDMEGGGDGVESKQKEKENETETNNEVADTGRGCTDNNTNKKVEGSEDKVVIDSGEEVVLDSSLTDPPQSTQPTQTECEVADTIVTRISLPESSILCPRVNISLSYDSISKDISTSEDEEALDEFSEDHHHHHHHHHSNLYHNSVLSNKPKARVRKLTPISTPPISISPLKTVCELQIIEEGETAEQVEDEGKVEKGIAVYMTSGRSRGNVYESDNEVQETVNKDGEPEAEDDQENSPMYTDENIDEVLGKEDEVETCVDDETQFEGVTEEEKVKKELDIFTPKEIPEKKIENSEKPLPAVGNYENVFISNQVPQIGMSPDSELYSTLSFPLGFRPSIEPPKEKPPPPPLELSDDEMNKPELPPKPSLRRVDSTKRIKKEIRKKRSDFLGIEGSNEDNYLEPEIYVAPPPDMMTFLQEERRFEKQLYRQSICSESDSNHETAESRDSGVELDRGHVDDICWSKPDVLSEPHSRQNSETFGNTSVTSEEDEILKKEREIIEVLEKEEQWRYGNKNSHSAEESEIGEKLAVKLRQLEQEKMQLERERAEEEDRRKAEESARRQNEQRLIAKQQQLLEQENVTSNTETPFEQEALRFERERLQKEQEHLERCRQNLLKQQQNPEPVEIRHHESKSHWDTPSNRHSLQEVPIGVPMIDVPRHSMQDVSQPQYQAPMSSGYRYSLPDLQQSQQRSNRPPPPIPPAKPIQRPMTQAQWERETNIRNSRIPSADNIPLQIEASTKLRHGSSVPAINVYPGGQQMTRSTLHALSAAPRSRLISSEHWMQPKRKVDAPKSNYNYQHWLIQEAEHRRILEHQQKISHQHPIKRMPYNGQAPANYGGSAPSHHTVGLPISPQVQNQTNHKWISPPRSNKPLPDAVIQTLTQRVQNRENKTPPRKRVELPETSLPNKVSPPETHPINQPINNHSSGQSQERMLSVSGKKKCSHCNEELGRGAAMIIESLRLFYHIDCFKCCVCHVQLGDGLMGTDVRVRNNKLHCHNCYSSDDAAKRLPMTPSPERLENESLNKVVVVVVVVVEEETEENDADGKFPAAHATPPSSPSSTISLPSDDCPDDFDIGGLESFFTPFVDPPELSGDVPEWFRTFYAAYQHNESRKFSLIQELSLRMIDFEIEKCELLIQIINRLQNIY